MSRIINNLLGKFKPENNDNQRPHDAHTPESESVLQNRSPAKIASTPPDIPLNILAFRTITTMLSQLPRSKPIEAIDNLEGQIKIREDRREIRICDAFAHLVAGDNDVAALTTTHNFKDGAKLSIMTCTQTNNLVGETLLPTSTPENLKAKMKVWYLMFTRNFKRDDLTSSSGTPYPTIISSSGPDDLGGRTAFAYMVGLEEFWIKPSLSTHLWILSNVLIEKHPRATDTGREQFKSELSKHLSRYIAAMSHKKIARRFNNKNLSIPYLESLKQVETRNIQSTYSGERAGNHPRDLNEVDSDRLFLDDFVKMYEGRTGLLKTNIPNLINKIPTSKSDDFELYTNETCAEFHLLLLELLDSFKNALDGLAGLDFDKADKSHSSDLNVKKKKFNWFVGNVHRNGYALLRLSRGRAFQLYLENIQTLLKDPRGSSVGASIGEDEEEIDEEEIDEEEIDEELEAIQSEKALLKSYTAWLRLMVGHFDAVEILVRFVTSKHFPYHSISIDILVPPPTDSSLLSWSRLFTDKFLPKSGGSTDTSNSEIYDFLEKGILGAFKAKEAVDQAQKVLKLWNKKLVPEYNKIRQSLQNLETCTIAVAEEKATNLLLHFPKKKPVTFSNDNVIITNEIQALCEVLTLSDQDRFFLSLNNLIFKGTIHCEAFLSSLLPLFTRDIPSDNAQYNAIKILPQMKAYGSVIGVSKRCCPPCAAFLKMLAKKSEGDFVMRGSHGAISGCTLPPWTPSDIVDLMNERFGAILRQDLLTLMNPGHFRNRCKSTGSETLSLDSYEGSGGFVHQALYDTLDYDNSQGPGPLNPTFA